MKMNSSISAMTDVNCGISGQRAKSRMDIHRPLRYMAVQSERGILKRQTRSIQTEGHFGDIKENENFRRFNYRSSDKVYKEFMLYAIGRNINKYHRFLYEKLRKFEGKTA